MAAAERQSWLYAMNTFDPAGQKAIATKNSLKLVMFIVAVVILPLSLDIHTRAREAVEQFSQVNTLDYPPCNVATPAYGELLRGLTARDTLWDYIGSDSKAGVQELTKLICDKNSRAEYIHDQLFDNGWSQYVQMTEEEFEIELVNDICTGDHSFTYDDERKRELELFGDPRTRIFRSYISAHAAIYNFVYHHNREDSSYTGCWPGPFDSSDNPDSVKCNNGDTILDALKRAADNNIVDRNSTDPAYDVPSTVEQVYALFAISLASVWDLKHNGGKCFGHQKVITPTGWSYETPTQMCDRIYKLASPAPAGTSDRVRFTDKYPEAFATTTDGSRPIPHFATVPTKQRTCDGNFPMQDTFTSKYDLDRRFNATTQYDSQPIETCIATHSLSLTDQRRMFGVPDALGDFVGGLGVEEFGTNFANMFYEPLVSDDDVQKSTTGISQMRYLGYRLAAVTGYTMLALSVACFFIGHVFIGLVSWVGSNSGGMLKHYFQKNGGEAAQAASSQESGKNDKWRDDYKSTLPGISGAIFAIVGGVYGLFAEPIVTKSPYYVKAGCPDNVADSYSYQSVWVTTETDRKAPAADVVPYLLFGVAGLWGITRLTINCYQAKKSVAALSGNNLRDKLKVYTKQLWPFVMSFIGVALLNTVFILAAVEKGRQWNERITEMDRQAHYRGDYDGSNKADDDEVSAAVKGEELAEACGRAVVAAALLALFLGLQTDVGKVISDQESAVGALKKYTPFAIAGIVVIVVFLIPDGSWWWVTVIGCAACTIGLWLKLRAIDWFSTMVSGDAGAKPIVSPENEGLQAAGLPPPVVEGFRIPRWSDSGGMLNARRFPAMFNLKAEHL